jgi:hypothetical protein
VSWFCSISFIIVSSSPVWAYNINHQTQHINQRCLI